MQKVDLPLNWMSVELGSLPSFLFFKIPGWKIAVTFLPKSGGTEED